MNSTIKKILKPVLLPPYKWLTKDKIWIRKLLSTISPTYASRRLYKKALGKSLNLKNPQSLNEKALWLKLNTYYNNPLITECCDKYLVHDYVKRAGCAEILNELLAVWDNPDEINFDELPNQFVLKCNHGCGYNIIVKDKSKLNIVETKKKLASWLKEDYWKLYAETQYKFIKKKIIAEKFIKTKDETLPEDYKFFCINGIPDCVMLCTDRESGKPKFFYFDRQLQYRPEFFDACASKNKIQVDSRIRGKIAKNIDIMFIYAEKLAKPFPFVRVDLYNVDGRIIFGELTFLSSGGFDPDSYSVKDSAIDITRKIDKSHYEK